MSEDLMRSLAELVGRALARRWLDRTQRDAPSESPPSEPGPTAFVAPPHDPKEFGGGMDGARRS
jgi:hypothetical protein